MPAARLRLPADGTCELSSVLISALEQNQCRTIGRAFDANQGSLTHLVLGFVRCRAEASLVKYGSEPSPGGI
jgi:hypothetical protein